MFLLQVEVSEGQVVFLTKPVITILQKADTEIVYSHR